MFHSTYFSLQITFKTVIDFKIRNRATLSAENVVVVFVLMRSEFNDFSIVWGLKFRDYARISEFLYHPV